MKSSMINPPILDLLEKVDNRYSLVVVTSKRARQIINGEKSLTEVDTTKPLIVAIDEIYKGAITYKTTKEGIK